ncbi:MAG: hypothetical protein GTO18_09520 [Anaerolineales bacterium]|nr:hypothetical protein [Anaerolineales bacterium]
MLEGWKTVFIAIFASTLAGAVFGFFIGVLTQDYLLWLAVMALVGAAFGVAMAYGFLPES